MHRSRIGIVLIDHPEEQYDAALAFWAGVQGVEPEPDAMYAAIGRMVWAHLEAQRTGSGTPPRVHLDIESDNVPAEVARVRALGATVLEDRGDYTISRSRRPGLLRGAGADRRTLRTRRDHLGVTASP